MWYLSEEAFKLLSLVAVAFTEVHTWLYLKNSASE